MNKRIVYMQTIICICAMLRVMSPPAFSEEYVQLDKDTVIQYALDTSEAYKISYNTIDRTHEKYREIRAQILPQVSGETRWTYNASFPGDTTDDYDMTNAISATQVLWAFGRIRSAIYAARTLFDISKLNTEAERRDVIYAATVAYYTAVLAEKTFSIVEGSYQNVVDNRRILEERSTKGRISKRDNIKIEADVAARIPEMSNARAQREAALNTLRMTINVPFNKDIILTESFSDTYAPLDYNKLEATMMKQEPTLQGLEENLKVTGAMVAQQKAGYLPVVSAFGSYSYDGGDNTPEIGTHNLDSYSSAGIKVSVPLFTGFETHAKVAQAEIDNKNATLELQQAQEDIILTLKNAVSNYHAFCETLTANNEAVRLAEESFRLSQEMFAAGQVSVTDLNDAELQFSNQRLSREQTLYNINITLAEIERLTAQEGIRA